MRYPKRRGIFGQEQLGTIPFTQQNQPSLGLLTSGGGQPHYEEVFDANYRWQVPRQGGKNTERRNQL